MGGVFSKQGLKSGEVPGWDFFPDAVNLFVCWADKARVFNSIVLLLFKAFLCALLQAICWNHHPKDFWGYSVGSPSQEALSTSWEEEAWFSLSFFYPDLIA